MRKLWFVLVAMFAWLALAPATAEAQNCGGPGQRACCLLEANFGACRDGMTEVNGCATAGIADCDCRDANGNVGLFDSNSHCKQATACGGPGQRACCVGEAAACQAGLAELSGCDGDCFCGGDANPFGISSSGTCIQPSPCGAKGQRACIVGERAGAPCDGDLIQVPRCVGDCFGKGAGSSIGISSGMCTTPETIAEPTTNRTQPAHDAPTTASSTCPLYGYMDMHLHLFAELAHGGGVLGGRPYDEAGGVNAALQQCSGSDLPFVNQDLKTGAETAVLTPGLSCPTEFYPDGCGSRLLHGGHDIFNDSAGFGTRDGALEGLGGENSTLGSPIFNGWPRWTTTTHQQAYYKWLERAWQGGLRLTTMLAVTNEALCKGGKHLAGINCENSMLPIEQQIAEAKKFESFIDRQYGADKDNKGWFRIVLTPAEARQAIASGKLAVVLGVETAELFNCKFPIEQCKITDNITTRTVTCPATPDPNQPYGFTQSGPLTVPMTIDGTQYNTCTPEFVKKRVQQLYDLGVRHVFPIHNFDNGFGAAATWQDAIEVGNRVVEKHWWFPEACPVDPEPYGFKLGDLTQFALSVIKFLFPGVITESPDRVLSTDPPSCNAFGLFGLGRTLVNELMDKGMLIDVDHMSRKAFDETLDIAEERSPKYPGIVASHVISFDNYEEERRHERMRTRSQLERIKGVGGMIAAMLKDDVLDGDQRGLKYQRDYTNATVKNDCRSSSKSFAQAFEYAVDVMGGPVAMGSDFNGVAGHFGPRFGSDACGGEFPFNALEAISNGTAQLEWFRERSAQHRANNRLEYPFTLPGFGTFDKQVTGQRTFDYNVDGMAHIGLLPDFVADLRKIGMAESDLNMLFRSAEAYIKVWEGARQVGLGEQPAANAPSCVSVTGHYPAKVHDGDLVLLTASANPSGAAITWDLGDGHSATGPIVFHSYDSANTYTVTVRAQDPLYGGVAQHTGSILVETSNNTLFGAQIKINAPAQTFEGDEVQVTFQHSDFQWRFHGASCGGGVVPQNLVVTPGILQPTTGSMKCTYPGGLASAQISITVVKKDLFGQIVDTFTLGQPIQVLNRPPAIVGASSASIAFGNSFTLALGLNDVVGDTLRLSVDWGDGSAPETLANLPPGPRNLAHFYVRPSRVGSPYAVAISLSDEAATVQGNVLVDVVGPPPNVALEGPARAAVGATAQFRFFGLDPDGGSVSLTQLSCGAGTLVRSDLLPVSPAQDSKSYFFDCEFTAANPANPVSVTYTDDEGRKTTATRLLRIGTPPNGLLVKLFGSIDEGAVGALFVQGYPTDDDDVTLASLSCAGASPVSQSPDLCTGLGCGAQNLHVDFACRFADGPADVVVSATLHDADGDTVQTVGVTVNNLPPSIVSLTGPGRLVPGETGGAVIKASDPGADRLTATINWGDGTSSSVEFLVGVPAPGALVQASVGHIWERPGTYTVAVTVADDDGGVSPQQTLQVQVVDVTPPVVTVPATITREAASALGTAVGFSASATDDVDGPLTATCSPASDNVFALGPTTVLCEATDAAGNKGSASFQVEVVDTTAPDISLSVSPEANAAGWHKDPVSIKWTPTDLVGVTSATGCGAASFLDDTLGTVVTCTARDAAGNTSSKSVTVKVDRTTPQILFGAASPEANANGWHKSDVSLGYTFSDAGSGLVPGAPTGGTLAFSNEGAGLSQTVTTADVAGNVASVSSPAIHLDKTPPQIAGSRSPLANASGWNNSAVTVSFNCSDSLSGIEACSPSSILGAEGASQSQGGSARDLAGNTASALVGEINIDFTPPSVACSNSAPALWPPNHKLVGIQTSVTVDGGLSGATGFTLVRVTSSEPDNGLGDGDTAGDIQGFVPGTPDTSGQLRAERSGRGPGRLYSLVYEGGDLAGNNSTCTTIVSVPHSQGNAGGSAGGSGKAGK